MIRSRLFSHVPLRRLTRLLSVALALAAAGQASAQNPLGALRRLDPTQDDSVTARVTGHTLNPGALLPRPRPPQGTVITDPEPERVTYTIDARTGDVYAQTRTQGRHRTGIKATATVVNGRRVWSYAGVTTPIPNDVTNQGLHYEGINLVLENQTPRRLSFKAYFDPDTAGPPGMVSFNTFVTLDPGERKGAWHLPPTVGIEKRFVGPTPVYRMRIEAVDPATGRPVGWWGAGDTSWGLAPSDEREGRGSNAGTQRHYIFFRLAAP